MGLEAAPNAKTPVSIRKGDSGWPTFAVQGALNHFAVKQLARDGTFGEKTGQRVIAYQKAEDLAADGIAGPVTQASLVRGIDGKVHDVLPRLPAGLLRGFADSESSNYLGAVNWNIGGGVDCGVMQIRCLIPFQLSALKAAYGPHDAMLHSAELFLARFDEYDEISSKPREYLMRCAALAHNWPAGALKLAKGQTLSTTSEATWARILDKNGQPIPDPTDHGRPKHVRFPDGAVVWSHADWAQFYAMGGPHGEGRVTRYVTDW